MDSTGTLVGRNTASESGEREEGGGRREEGEIERGRGGGRVKGGDIGGRNIHI